MTPKQAKMYLKENGFNLWKEGSKHLLYSDGKSLITLSRGGHSSNRNVRNFMAEVQRAIQKRPPEVVKPAEEREVDIARFNQKRVEAHPAPGEVKPLSNGHDEEKKGRTGNTFRDKFNSASKLKLQQRIIELWTSGKITNKDLQLALMREGFKEPNGTDPVHINTVNYFTKKLLEAGVIKQILVPPRPDAGPMTAPRKPGKLPDTVMGILTDPELTAEQKVRMVMAYAEL